MGYKKYSDEFKRDVLAQFDPAAEEQRHRFFGVEWFLDEEERRKRLRG